MSFPAAEPHVKAHFPSQPRQEEFSIRPSASCTSCPPGSWIQKSPRRWEPCDSGNSGPRAQTLLGPTQLGWPEIALRSAGPQATPNLHGPSLGAGEGPRKGVKDTGSNTAARRRLLGPTGGEARRSVGPEGEWSPVAPQKVTCGGTMCLGAHPKGSDTAHVHRVFCTATKSGSSPSVPRPAGG